MSLASVVQSLDIEIQAGLELLDSSDALISDISEWLLPSGADVSHDNTALIHGSCRLLVSEPLLWESQRVRPYVWLTDQLTGESYRWDLGIFLLDTPARITGSTPAQYRVEGYDKLVILESPHGASYSLDSGALVLAAVEALIDAAAGAGQHSIDQTAAAVTAPVTYTWLLDDGVTTLTIINELLASIGYVSLYADRQGQFRSAPYVPPTQAAPAVAYDAGDPQTTVAEGATFTEDLFSVPNRWVFIRDQPDPSETLPSEGDGIYTVLNQSDGPTSIDSRGRVLTEVVRLAAADQASLVVQGDKHVAQSRRPLQALVVKTSPDPRLWHQDVVTISDPELGLAATPFISQQWRLPLDGSDMDHSLAGT